MTPGEGTEPPAAGSKVEPSSRPLAIYILLRLLLGLGLLGVSTVVLLDQPGQVEAMSPKLSLAAALFLVMGISAALLPRFGRRSWFPWSQLLLDALFAVALVSSSGGPTSPFFPLFFVNILAAAFLLPASGALVVALADSVLYIGLIVVQGLQWFQAFYGANTLLSYSQLVLQLFAFVLVGVLSTVLSRSLRQARVALEQQLRVTSQLRERHELILEKVDAGVVVVDSAGRVSDCNPAALRLLGSIQGLGLEEVLTVDGRRWEQVFSRSDQVLTLSCSRIPLEAGGEVVMVEDITRVREMERAMARQERLGAVGRLAAGLAHEIRNPLASLSGSVQLLRDEGRSPLHDIVLREVKRLNELVEDFLDSARPVRLEVQPVDASQIIGEVATAFRNDARYRGKLVLRTAASALPQVPLDASRLRQVLWNLLLNAAQATPDFGTVSVSGEVEGDHLLVVVEDDGVGIEPVALARIFDPFYTTRSGGTGLGLANVERVLLAHGGTVRVSSVPGEGTRFELRFPLAGPPPSPPPDGVSP